MALAGADIGLQTIGEALSPFPPLLLAEEEGTVPAAAAAADGEDVVETGVTDGLGVLWPVLDFFLFGIKVASGAGGELEDDEATVPGVGPDDDTMSFEPVVGKSKPGIIRPLPPPEDWVRFFSLA